MSIPPSQATVVTGIIPGLVLAVSIGLATSTLSAQSVNPRQVRFSGEIESPSIMVFGGAFVRTDYQGEGTSPTGGVRIRLPLSNHFALAPEIGYVGFEGEGLPEDVGPNAKLMILDFQLQYAFLSGDLRPHIGVGGGGAIDFRDERGSADFVVSTFTASAGATLGLGDSWFTVGEFRYRTLDEFRDRAFSVRAGLGVKF